MVLAPQLSALRGQFAREDLEVVAGYMETCGGVPDHRAGVREQVTEHGLDYPVLDIEAGQLDDPSGKRYRWAPRAIVLDREGRIVLDVPHMPAMKTLAADLTELVHTGRVAPGPDHGWRRANEGAWVRFGIEDAEGRRVVRRTLSRIHRIGVTLESTTEGVPPRVATTKTTLSSRHKLHDDRDRTWTARPSETIRIDGRAHPCRVTDTSWTRVLPSGKRHEFTERTWVAGDAALPDTLLRRRTTRRATDATGAPTGREITWTRRIETFAAERAVADRDLRCWVVATTSNWDAGSAATKTWLSTDVPGHTVREETTTRSHGAESVTTTQALDFATSK